MEELGSYNRVTVYQPCTFSKSIVRKNNDVKTKMLCRKAIYNTKRAMCMPEYTDIIYSSSIISTYNKWTYQSRVAINNDLIWDIRIKNVINTVINTFLYLLSRVKVFLSFQNRKRFYNAYILPNFGAARAILDVSFYCSLRNHVYST